MVKIIHLLESGSNISIPQYQTLEVALFPQDVQFLCRGFKGGSCFSDINGNFHVIQYMYWGFSALKPLLIKLQYLVPLLNPTNSFGDASNR